VERPAGETTAPRLHCLAGQSAAAELARDARLVAALPPAAREHLWEVLGPSLRDPVPPGLEATLDAFVRAHAVDAVALALALKAHRFLLRQAAALNLEPRQFAEDLAALAGHPEGDPQTTGTDGGPDVVAALMPLYPRAVATVRDELIRRTLADHGNVLEEIRWRVELLSSSDRVLGLRVPILVLTLHYRKGERLEQLTLQLLPDLVRRLGAVAERALTRRG